ncbi:tRNA 2-selenouridine(34) synthase MnmH [Bacillus sp. Marseille-P3661]|uniref:tRNA 2-selenouridine(34) synthase MnmH n=1 Tax=Bacillus sp. Marseille-P3661 TaxID=1936234 RepID=UPI000C83CDEE|nr:tRNA 2-selenouridine(34) synthase MnmH [Bacillus sp. Marseille-P3661]
MLLSIPTISIEDALNENTFYIDVRSPKEFDEFHITGAINIPLFTNEERAKIGTTYKQISQEKAIELGVEILSKKLPDFYHKYKECAEMNKEKTIVVYCWRGGMRSRSIVSIMAAIGIPLFQLLNGIRSYRQLIAADLERLGSEEKPYIVLEGLTGTRKTDILQALESEGYPVIDLERLAGHRGSTFGAIGLKPRSQKEFEKGLWERLSELKEFPYYIIEAESKRIGKVILPDFILKGKDRGVRIHINASIESRAKAICETYQFEKNFAETLEAMAVLKKRIPPTIVEYLYSELEKKNFSEFVRILLEEYYDPRYSYAANKLDTPVNYVYTDDLNDGINVVKAKINELVKYNGLLTI